MTPPDALVEADRAEAAERSGVMRRWAWALALLWLVVAGWLLFTSDPATVTGFSSLGHYLLFGALATANVAVALTFATDARSEMRVVSIAAAATAVVAVGTEAIQHVLPVRQLDAADLAFDITGIGTAAIASLFFLTVLPRKVLIKSLIGAGAAGLVLLVAVLAVVASRQTVDLDRACPPVTSTSTSTASSTTSTDGSPGGVRVQLTAPTESGGCVQMNDGWFTPLLGAVAWDNDHDAVRFELGGLQSAPQRELSDAIEASGEFTLGVRLRPTDIYTPNVTRWAIELLDPTKPGRPLVRVVTAGRQVRSDVTGGDDPGDVAILAAANALLEDEWTEVVVVVDDATHQMFVDGELVGSLRRGSSDLATPDELTIVLGLREFSPAAQFRGQVSDVVVLPRAVDADNVNDLFDARQQD